MSKTVYKGGKAYHPTAMGGGGGWGHGRKPVWFDLGIYGWFLVVLLERGKGGGGIRSYAVIIALQNRVTK
jgi:hypothetical protein